jgi:hypothetical protein
MVRIMRDSTTAADIPLNGTDMAAGYVNGRFAWDPGAWARFGNRPTVRIDVNGTDPGAAGVLDVEAGDATPGEAPLWVKARRQLHPGITGHGCTIYCSQSEEGAVVAAMAHAGLVPVQHYTLWLASWGISRTSADMLGKGLGVVAVQWKGSINTGGHWDESIVYDDQWHPSPVPPPPPPAPPTWQAKALADARAVVAALEAHQ